MASTPEIFLSYARADAKDVAENLQRELGGEEHCFLDSTNIELLAEFPTTIVDALLGAKVVLVILSPRYPKSWYCWKEWLIALGPYQAARAGRLSELEKAAALGHVVVALHDADASAFSMMWGPIRRRNWPRADESARVVEAVRSVLDAKNKTVEHLLTDYSVDQRIREVLTDARRVAEVPRRAGTIPTYPTIQRNREASLDEGFIGRADDFWHLHYALVAGSTEGAAALTASLIGGGGFGKTRLALEYFHRLGPVLYPGGNIWIDAAGDAEGRSVAAQIREVDATLRQAHADLVIPPSNDGREALAHTLKCVGAQRPILYVIDNLPDSGSLGQMEDYCPAAKEATVLLTSRREVRWTGVQEVQLDTLPLADAVMLLQRGIPNPEDHLSEEQWAELAEEVGRLPLVLEILNGALTEDLTTATDLAQRVAREDAINYADPLCAALKDLVPERHLRGIAESFRMSLERLENDDARELLLRSSWLAPAPLPFPLLSDLTESGDRANARFLLAHLRKRSWLPKARTGGAAPGDPTHQLHRVVAAFLRSAQSPKEARPRIHAVANVAKAHTEKLRDADSTTLEDLSLLHPHLRALERHAMGDGDQVSVDSGWKTSWEAQTAWDTAVRARMGGILGRFPTPADLPRNRHWWPLVEGTALRDAATAWRDNDVLVAEIDLGLKAYREARPRERAVQAQVLMALERLHGNPQNTPPHRPLAPEYYAGYFDDCGLPPSPPAVTDLVSLVPCPPDGKPIIFTMGSLEGIGDDDERPHRSVTLSPFRLGRTPVTWSQYHAFDNKYGPCNPSNIARPENPVTEVTWWEAWLFCRWLGGDLPTEAQWEAACRAGTESEWSFGDEEALLDAHGWHRGNSGDETHPVGGKLPNPWGLHDVHGNVWEWCADWFGAYPTHPQSDPVGPADGTRRLLRGGGAWFDAFRCRSAFRLWNLPWFRNHDVGFRVALPPVPFQR